MPRPRSSRWDLPLSTGDFARGPRDESLEYTDDRKQKGIIDFTKEKKSYERSPILSSSIHTRDIQAHTHIRTHSILCLSGAIPVMSLLPNEVIAMQTLHLYSRPNVQCRCC